MRTHVYSALAALTFGLLTLAPAHANGAWTCMSPAFACGGAPTAYGKTYHERGAYVGERSHRRQASGKRSRQHVAKHHDAAPRHVAHQEQPKVEVPQRKEAQKQEPKQEKVERKEKTAERKVETEHSYRTTSTQSGMASFYGSESGSQTASGQRFNPSAMTAAHRSLPFGTKVRVTNKRNGKSVIVTINDRGPFVHGRIIDLSTAAAGVIGMRSSGVAPVTVERLGG
jgi:peptidoglycan lytic transglycosylase